MQKNNYTETLLDGAFFDMIYVPGGTFPMGSEEYDDEKPVHPVRVSGFHLAKYPVTQQLWKAVMQTADTPSYFKGDDRPVEQVSWERAKEFIEKLNQLTGRTYKLPTEAQWEYAARGGNQRSAFRYAGSHKLKEAGWYRLNSHTETKPVGLKAPNALGIYDLSGNVWEWCEDVWHENYKGAPEDGSAWLTGGEKAHRLLRGGSWLSDDDNCRVSSRLRNQADYGNARLGFRLARY